MTNTRLKQSQETKGVQQSNEMSVQAVSYARISFYW